MNHCVTRATKCSPHSWLDLPEPVSFSWHLSPIAPKYDRCYCKCLNPNEQLPYHSPTDSAAAPCTALQWIWGIAEKEPNSIDSNVWDGFGGDCTANTRPA